MPKIQTHFATALLACSLLFSACGGEKKDVSKNADSTHAEGHHEAGTASANADSKKDADAKDDKSKAETQTLIQAFVSSGGKAMLPYNAAGKVEDAFMSALDLKDWEDVAKYGGTYLGPFSSSIRKVVVKANDKNLAVTVFYDKSVISDDGMVDLIPASLDVTAKATAKGLVSLDKAVKLTDPARTLSRAQFVSWGGGQGLLVQGTDNGTPVYLLLRKE